MARQKVVHLPSGNIGWITTPIPWNVDKPEVSWEGSESKSRVDLADLRAMPEEPR